jgi:hypothetical protein
VAAATAPAVRLLVPGSAAIAVLATAALLGLSSGAVGPSFVWGAAALVAGFSLSGSV